MSTLSRRSIVTSAAALPALAVPVAAAAAIPAQPDPIFALIDRHQIAFEAAEAVDGNIPEDLADEAYQFAVQLAITKPTTLAGVIGILRYQREIAENYPGYSLFAGEGEAADPRCNMSEWLTLIEEALEDIAGVEA